MTTIVYLGNIITRIKKCMDPVGTNEPPRRDVANENRVDISCSSKGRRATSERQLSYLHAVSKRQLNDSQRQTIFEHTERYRCEVEEKSYTIYYCIFDIVAMSKRSRMQSVTRHCYEIETISQRQINLFLATLLYQK